MDLTVTGKRTTCSEGRMETTLALEKAKTNAIFRSTIDRFGVSYSAKNPGVRILKSNMGKKARIVTQSEQGKHMYDKEAVFGVENQITCIKNPEVWREHRTRASDYESVAGKKLGFDATSPRFNYN